VHSDLISKKTKKPDQKKSALVCVIHFFINKNKMLFCVVSVLVKGFFSL